MLHVFKFSDSLIMVKMGVLILRDYIQLSLRIPQKIFSMVIEPVKKEYGVDNNDAFIIIMLEYLKCTRNI